MAEAKLNSGLGVCNTQAELSITIPVSVAMMGGALGLVHRVFHAVHIHNTRVADGDRIGINAPLYDRTARGFARFGREVQLVGSESALAWVVDQPILDPVRDLVSHDNIYEFFPVSEGRGQAIFREQRSEKWSVGGITRKIRRAERLGRDTANLKVRLEQAIRDRNNGVKRDGDRGIGDIFITFNKLILSMNFATVQGADVPMVTTYGLSSKAAPLVCENRSAASLLQCA